MCDTAWGADTRCYERAANQTGRQLETSYCIVDSIGGCIEQRPQTSVEQYWERAVLNISSPGLVAGPGALGEVQMELAFSLLVSWLVVLVCLARGVRTSGKVVYFTATFPYVILLVLLAMSVSLPGAGQGLRYLFVPQWHKLADFQVWWSVTCVLVTLVSLPGLEECHLCSSDSSVTSRCGGAPPARCSSPSVCPGAASSCSAATTSSPPPSISTPISSPWWTSSPASSPAS